MLSQRPIECPTRLLADARKAGPLATAVVAAGATTPLESARQARDHGLMEPVLIGPRAAIEAAAKDIGWTLDGIRIVEAADDIEAARTGCALARAGEVDALMKGQLHTDILLKAMLHRANGLRAGRRFTHAFVMSTPDSERDLIITDAAINMAPPVDTRLDIIRNAVDLSMSLGVAQPRVAVLSVTEDITPQIRSSLDAAEIVRRWANDPHGPAIVRGPFALDVAIAPEAARIKGVTDPVAGQADIVVVPNIETGNALFKMMVWGMSACAAGLALGARVPVILTSRADPPEARLASVAIALMQARGGQPDAAQTASS